MRSRRAEPGKKKDHEKQQDTVKEPLKCIACSHDKRIYYRIQSQSKVQETCSSERVKWRG